LLTLDEIDGHIKEITRVGVSGAVFPLALSPNRRFLYAGLRSEPFGVTTFEIDQTSGMLIPLATGSLPDNMAYISTDQTGRFLFGASYFGDKISVNPIGQRGFVQPRPVQVIPTRPKAHAILPDASNSWVFATNLGGDVILQYKFDAVTGELTPKHAPARREREGGRATLLQVSSWGAVRLCHQRTWQRRRHLPLRRRSRHPDPDRLVKGRARRCPGYAGPR
jgi:6-phosphogluconolactonase